MPLCPLGPFLQVSPTKALPYEGASKKVHSLHNYCNRWLGRLAQLNKTRACITASFANDSLRSVVVDAMGDPAHPNTTGLGSNMALDGFHSVGFDIHILV
jgi:hypothetical protein